MAANVNNNSIQETKEIQIQKNPKNLQTLYQYFEGDGINSGLRAEERDWFELNGKKFRIFSGSLHYFRVHPAYWRDRLRKFRAAGLNAIDVYVPWNLHEPEEGVYDFGTEGRDFSMFLDLRGFLTMAKEEDLLVIFRPGPYICAEWDFGGLPSWLLSKHPMFVRTSQDVYLEKATQFIGKVVEQVKDLQFYTAAGEKGGPIIMTQIENEYGAFGYDDFPRDTAYLESLKDALGQFGIESLLFTSDSPKGTQDFGSIPGVFMTANFKYEGTENMEKLLEYQPNRPILVSEFWPGWFDHWFEPIHNILNLEEFEQILLNIFNYKASVNFYMFHGGTNFGFMNGANHIEDYAKGNKLMFPYYAPDVTSYDYNAPLTENGAYTEKYNRAAEMISVYDTLSSLLVKPERPEAVAPVAYPEIQITETLAFDQILDKVPMELREVSEKLKSMEQLSLNNGNGQSYGYIVYRKRLSLRQGSILSMRGRPRDLLQVMVNGVMVNEPIMNILELSKFGSWAVRDGSMTLDLSQVPGCNGDGTQDCVLDLFVENIGRTNYGKPHQFDQKKGLWEGPVSIDGDVIKDWEIIPLEFKGDWVRSLSGWVKYDQKSMESTSNGPRLLKAELMVEAAEPRDTFFDYDGQDSEWKHGAVFVNGFNIGRYHKAGPQKTMYIPGPLLKQGANEIVIMELYSFNGNTIKFTDTPYLGPELDGKKNKRKQVT